jgi:hypothetical protein
MLSSNHLRCSTWNRELTIAEPNITGIAAAQGAPKSSLSRRASFAPSLDKHSRAQYTGAGSQSAVLEPHAEGPLEQARGGAGRQDLA